MADQLPTGAPAAPIQNGVKPGAAQTPVTPPTQSAPQTPDELTSTRERLKVAEAAAERAKRDDVVRRRQFDRERQAERQSMGAKLKQADEYARIQKQKDINPAAAAKALWGDNWYQRLTEVQVNGGAPTAESVAFELEQRDRAWEEKFAARDADAQKKQQEEAQRANQMQTRAFRNELLEDIKKNGEEYPIFAQFKTHEQLADTLMRVINLEAQNTELKDSETGQLIRPGRLMSFKEAADSLEADMLAIADRAFGHEKYAPKFRERLQPQKPSGTVPNVVKSSVSQGSQSVSSSVSQPRKTLSNDLTGSTPSDAPRYRSEEQRRQDALSAFAAMAARKS